MTISNHVGKCQLCYAQNPELFQRTKKNLLWLLNCLKLSQSNLYLC